MALVDDQVRVTVLPELTKLDETASEAVAVLAETTVITTVSVAVVEPEPVQVKV